MSGILGFHDLTYKLLAQILKLAIGSVVWSVESLVTAVRESLDSATVRLLEESDKDPDKEISRLIHYAKRKGYINSKLQTTEAGATRLSKLNFGVLEMEGQWDGRWRIVMYDIPEEKRSARDHIRRLVGQLGFVQLQRSVWVHPLPCLEQFKAIKEAHGLDDALIMIETTNLPGISEHKSHFTRIYPRIKF